MSQANVDLILSLYGIAERGDWESPYDAFDPNIVWDMSGFRLPDLARVYRGHDGLRRFWEEWLDAWETIEFTRAQPEDLGDHVIVEIEQRNVGRKSGVAVDFHYFQAWALRDGKVTESHMAATRAEALAAVGLGA